jgi:hypothetical protein
VAFFEDLSPCDDFGEECSAQLVAVGWLERRQAYARGEVDDTFVEKLIRLLVDPWEPFVAAGGHHCEFCRLTGGPASLVYEGMTVTLGAANLFVPADGFLYVAPSLIAHYIDAHEYAPPPEFREAVRSCPSTRSMEYRRAILANGGRPLFRLSG